MKINIIKSIFFSYIAVLVFFPLTSFAAEILLQSNDKQFVAGQEFLMQVYLDTKGDSVNTIEGELSYPIQLIEIKEIRDGNSIINFWIERLKVNGLENKGFSGVIPGGYQGEKGFLFSIVFKTKAIGMGNMAVKELKIFQNDGNATNIPTKVSSFSFSVSKESNVVPSTVLIMKEKDSPEEFKPEIGQSEDMLGSKYFLVFATQDKGSGIDHYEVREGFWNDFISTTSPYVIKNQNLDEKIYIRAVDNNGNTRTEIIYGTNWIPWYKNYWVLFILVAGIVLLSKYLNSRKI